MSYKETFFKKKFCPLFFKGGCPKGGWVLFLLFITGFLLRIYHLNWDQNYHLHPDERQITMVAENISLPQKLNFSSIFSPESPLNPKFFAYGSFPIYLLKFSADIFSVFYPQISTYDKINLLGRVISALFDSFTILLIYQITQKLFSSRKTSLLAAVIYTLSVFPIQLSHFYAVDTLLTFFICLTLYRSIILYRTPSAKNAIISGICFGLALATKVSATVLVVSFFFSFLVETLLSLKKEIFSQEISFFKKIKKYLTSALSPSFWIKNRIFKVKKVIFYSLLTITFTVVTFIVCEPFALFDFTTFWRQINEQNAMTKNAFVFPYTLQYVHTTPYWYQIKNIFLWGFGPPFALLALLGIFTTFRKLVKGLITPGNETSEGSQLIIFSFFIVYFLVVGCFAVKFMRYCLPLYPILAIFAANFLSHFKKPVITIFFVINLFWLFAFLNIYNIPNTRVSATSWINQNIPANSTILREHWDDGLPLGYTNYNLIDLPLYDSDNISDKWPKILNYLSSADYLVIASNRLYVPLQKLTDCNNLPSGYCYTATATYYQNLFSGKLGYVKVAEFSNNPSFLGLEINDQSADESFTVYDHPRVIIFKNINKKNNE